MTNEQLRRLAVIPACIRAVAVRDDVVGDARHAMLRIAGDCEACIAGPEAAEAEDGYVCIEGESPYNLQAKVNNAMRAGFRPLGAPIAWGQNHGRFMQAMTTDAQAMAERLKARSDADRDGGAK